MKVISLKNKNEPNPPKAVRLISENRYEEKFLSSLIRNTEDWDCYPHTESGLIIRFYEGDDYGRLIKLLYNNDIYICLKGADNAL